MDACVAAVMSAGEDNRRGKGVWNLCKLSCCVKVQYNEFLIGLQALLISEHRVIERTLGARII